MFTYIIKLKSKLFYFYIYSSSSFKIAPKHGIGWEVTVNCFTALIIILLASFTPIPRSNSICDFLESHSSIFASAHLWENPYNSIVRESLQILIGRLPPNGSRCAEFEPTIGEGALQRKKKNFIHLHIFEEKLIDIVDVMLGRLSVSSRCYTAFNNFT